MYTLCDKAVSLTPYDPSEGRYRVRMDANESFLLPTERDRVRMAQAAADTALNRYPRPAGCRGLRLLRTGLWNPSGTGHGRQWVG